MKGKISLSKREAVKSHFSKTAEKDLEDALPNDERGASIALVVFDVLIGLYFVVHQIWSTGFFTATFGTLGMFLLYGSLIYWIATSSVLLLGHKRLSRNIDYFGGLIFATVGSAWLFVVFPFEFNYFADVLPEILRFIVQWISNDIARVLMGLGFIVHLVLAVYVSILYVFVRKVRRRKSF